jgi:hypothetical protein
MSSVPAGWLITGGMHLGSQPKDKRFSYSVRSELQRWHQGAPFAIRFWPKVLAFPHTVWWYEKAAPVYAAASFFASVDHEKGPGLYAGVRVEKGYGDRKRAAKAAQRLGGPIERYLLDDHWDWHRFLRSLHGLPEVLEAAETALRDRQVYLWAEFHWSDDRADRREEANLYCLFRNGQAYTRGRLRPLPWKDVAEFAQMSRPELWGEFTVACPFGLADARPAIDEADILAVLEAMKPVRDLWRQ